MANGSLHLSCLVQRQIVQEAPLPDALSSQTSCPCPHGPGWSARSQQQDRGRSRKGLILSARKQPRSTNHFPSHPGERDWVHNQLNCRGRWELWSLLLSSKSGVWLPGVVDSATGSPMTCLPPPFECSLPPLTTPSLSSCFMRDHLSDKLH